MKIAGGTACATMLTVGAVYIQTPPIPQFLNLTERSKIGFLNHSSHTSHKYLPETMAGGVAMLDYNNDGLLDLFCQRRGAERSHVRLNRSRQI